MNFFYLINIILLSRLFVLFKDEPISVKQLLVMISIQVAGLLYFTINLSWFIILFSILLITIIFFLSEKKAANLNLERFIFLVIYFIIAGIASSDLADLTQSYSFLKIYNTVSNYFFPFKIFNSFDFYLINLVLFGILILLNEINFLVRLTFKLFGLSRMWQDIDEEEFNTGRLIGMLERIFIFLFVIFNQYAAIGFIIAAKGVTRFKELENRNFAEYILIGTLLSTLTAVLIGLVINFIIYSY